MYIFLCSNIIAMPGNEAHQDIDVKIKDRKHPYKYNWQNAYLHLREKIIALVNNTNLYKIINYLIKKKALSVVAVIKDRAFNREKQSSRKARLFQCYK